MTERELLAIMAATLAARGNHDDLGSPWVTRPSSDALFYVEQALDILAAVDKPVKDFLQQGKAATGEAPNG